MEWVGYAGAIALTLSWLPQSLETVRSGTCSMNLQFLLLLLLGNVCLMTYAYFRHDPVFTALNAISTIGILVNLRFKILPRKASH